MQAILVIGKETRQEAFKFERSPEGEINFRPPLKNLQQRFKIRRHLLSLVVLILNINDVSQPLSAPLLWATNVEIPEFEIRGRNHNFICYPSKTLGLSFSL